MSIDDNAELQNAAFRGDLSSVRHLLAQGADPNGLSEEGWTALALAANRGNVDVVQELVDAGADVNFAEDEEGETVLMLAVQQAEPRAVDVLCVLLTAGANVNAVDKLGWTALRHAHNRPELASILLAHGADPSTGG
jgi:ankyrin repeat protein